MGRPRPGGNPERAQAARVEANMRGEVEAAEARADVELAKMRKAMAVTEAGMVGLKWW